MKMKSFKRVLALALATAMALTACGQTPASNTSETQKESTPAKESEVASESEKAEVKKEDLPVITLYPANANLFSGLEVGHRSDYFAGLGFQLEVWAFSDDKTTAMLTSGDLPDMMYVAANSDTLQTLIETDKIINYADYEEYLPNFFETTPNDFIADNIELIKENYSAGTGGLYVLPFSTGTSSGYWNQVGTFDRNVVKLKWDVYEKIGAPEIEDMWGLIDVMEEMLEAEPTAADGTKMYGTFLDTGFDSDYWGSMFLWYSWHGYDRTLAQYLIEGSNVTGEIQSILTEDSLYYQGLKWYNEVYRRGLMDPDSISTARGDQAPKIDNGYATVPSGTLPGWATKYYEVFVPGTSVYVDFTTDTIGGGMTSIVIKKDTDHLEECLAFVNMMADPMAGLILTYGPEGDIWEADGNVLSITDEFAAWLEEKGSINFFPMSDGTEWATWNTPSAHGAGDVLKGYVDINGDPLPSIPTSWPDAQAITTANDNWNAWKKTMNADSLWDYCEKNDIDVCQESAFAGLVLPTPDDNQLLTMATIKDVMVPGSWQCVYAETDEEFEQTWDKMVKDALALGAQDIIDWRIKCYEDAMAAK